MASPNFFTDKFGRQTVFEVPNAPLIGWGVFGLASLMALTPRNADLFKTLSKGSLVLWALGEALRGQSGFRRSVGAATLFRQLMPASSDHAKKKPARAKA
ncbi:MULTISPECIES: hypothetical protein [unclassified Arthrobacter]|uniref:hypothetical protein n=1 Tax=unclassified Arthrobacter TaxID=235627 RepID=UPI001D15B646|nr:MULTISPECIES: hypothetical protein [unclassified Arthrobacter]MCC3275655.1 hypothetical protein [Arthrobacter sp. zg-Y20]MCC3278733.1 hypothetical protein [Arthrobacter sp. zg-Y40]MCC9177095.1 hypothetical protein [Arthrobacter sp. zg-Y750]MDK1315812.1 hypothetical protein [Arthrobacter sp. zg.Y20]MDK1326193.1 hypothetical protein [Arthrobacter sp. zg-Y1143]